MNTSLPPWLVFVFVTIVAVLLWNGLYHSYRTGSISYTRWYGTQAYRRDTQPVRYWLCMALTGFAFAVCTIGAVLLVFLG